jgi:inosine/xanthosine triphosphatase
MSKRVAVGTKNQVKLDAVEEILRDYTHLADALIEAREVTSDVADQPLSLEETVRGARNRAKNAFGDCDYAIGIESGLMEVPYTKSGYMDICVAAIHDGTDTFLGISSAWEFKDPEIARLMHEEGLNMTEACNKVGLANDPKLGAGQGAIGVVTKGRVDRKEYTKQALRMALIHIDN